jgi:hypothetical protein
VWRSQEYRVCQGRMKSEGMEDIEGVRSLSRG